MPLARIRQAIERRRIRALFGRYVDDATLDKLLRGEPVSPVLKERSLSFVLVALRHGAEAEMAARLKSLVELAMSQKAFVDVLVPHLAIVAFGQIEEIPVGQPRNFLIAAAAELGDCAKFVHASGIAKFGDYGAPPVMRYGFIHPAFPRALELLGSIEYGCVLEVQ